MIAGIFHEGSGLGNQLFRYITVRTLAEDKGFEWGMAGSCKGDFFPNLDTGKEPGAFKTIWNEKKIVQDGLDVRGYDPEIHFIEDSTIMDGEFQDERYWGHNLRNIDRWLAVEPLKISDDLCVLGFRGGEYTAFPDLFLTQEYWDSAIREMRRINNNMRFEVHTDDPETARKVLSIQNSRKHATITQQPLEYGV